MEDLPSRRLEALSAHIEGLGAALDALNSEESRASLRRITRSLARTADDLALPHVAERARRARSRPDEELAAAARELLGFLLSLRPSAPPEDEHVLIVEDNPTVAAALLSYLRQERRVVHVAATAGQAEGILTAHPIDLVLLDLVLPDRDGRDLLLQLREDPETAALPVIVLAARAGSVTRAECLAVGARGFLEKPADPETLRQAVALLLDEGNRGEDARLDVSTGILSRAGLTEAYRALRSRTGKVEGPPAVAMLAVEPFEQILRLLGRDGANHFVKTVAQHVSASLHPRDEVGRWTERELLVLLPNTSSSDAWSRLENGLSGLAAAGILDRRLETGAEITLAAGVAIAESGADLRDAAFAAECSAQPARREGSRISFAPLPGESTELPRVLLVEDDRVMATLIQHRLVREGFDVMDFLNGEDAFRWASTSSFDVAILDIEVPGMDGFEILERLRAIPRLRDVPVIALTASVREEDVVQALELGADDYVLKPFSPVELLARVRRLATGSRRARTRAGTPAGTTSAGRTR